MDDVHILFCQCSRTDLLDPGAREAIASALKGMNSAAKVWIVDDLCGLAERRDERLAEWVSNVARASCPCPDVPRASCPCGATENCEDHGQDGRGTHGQDAHATVVIACHDRAVRSLFEFAGCPLPAAGRVINARDASVEEATGAVQSLLQASVKSSGGNPNDADKQAGRNVGLPVGAVERKRGQTPISNSEIGLSPHFRDPTLQSDWSPWYPVIDSSRCVQCRKCLGFCLFGVYAMDGDKVRVANPRACKNNCPACARVCPQLAIIFPKCKDSPINGAAIREQDLARKDLKVDIEAIVRSGDLYAELRKRAGGPDLKDGNNTTQPRAAVPHKPGGGQ